MSGAAVPQSSNATIPLPGRSAGSEPLSAGSVNMLLRSPQSFAELVREDRLPLRASLLLLGVATGFYAAYGLAMGVFTSGNALWMAPLKAALALLASLGLCTPSLYVLLGLGGAAITLRQAVALASGVACLSGVLMLGFAPVAWLFGVSTYNLQILVILHGVVWAVALTCGLRLLALALPGGHRRHKPVIVWCAIFLLVSAQMLTYLRPVLTVSPTGRFREPEKKFFFEHFYDSMAGTQPGMATDVPAPAPAPVPGYTPAPAVPPMSN